MAESTSNIQSDNKRIAKNTIILYIRMGITMIVQLYTSRIVLQALGVTDYGIYNIVGTFVVMFSFISNPLGTATQRFYNFELGKGDYIQLNKVFNISFYIFLILALGLFLLLEPIGSWYVLSKMNMPIERTSAAMFAFQFSLVSFLFSLTKTPFESMIIANERMSFFAYISIIEVLLKLGNAFSLLFFGFDKLILFTFNQLLITIICFCCIIIYSKREFVAVKLRRIWDKSLFKQLLSFTGWSLFGSVASMSADQGVSLVINYFCGVAVNAAVGIANQVSASVNQFVANFQVAFRPQMVKLYAGNEIESLRRLIINSAKYSYLLLFAIACPVIFNADYLLKLWLGVVPEYATEFVILNIVYMLLETFSAPLWMTIQATGKIKKYQLVISSVMLLNIFLSIILLSLGLPPFVVLIVKCILDIVYLAIRLTFVHKKIDLPFRKFFSGAMIPALIITVICSMFYALLLLIGFSDIVTLLGGSFVFIVFYLPLVFYTCVAKNDRELVFSFVKKKIKL